MADSHLIGKAGEYRVASELMIRNHIVYMPTVDNGADLILGTGQTIQVKCGHRRKATINGCIHLFYSFSFVKSSSYFRKIKFGGDNKIEPHKLNNVDFAILWGIDDDEFYIVPANKVRGKMAVNISADDDRRTIARWNKWLPYRNNWGILDGGTVESNKLEIELECKQCGYKWLPITPNPTRCPQCNGRWHQKMYDHTCKRCGHTWHSRIEHPNWCTKCNSKVWDKEIVANNRERITCVKCGHNWQPEVDKPSRCPKCKTHRFRNIKEKMCKRCGYIWWSTDVISYQCPKCHSRRWDKDLSEIFPKQCNQCGYEWVSETPNPKSCPHCYSHRWNREKEILYPKTCKQCGHEWASSVSPVACPQCHSIKWNRESALAIVSV